MDNFLAGFTDELVKTALGRKQVAEMAEKGPKGEKLKALLEAAKKNKALQRAGTIGGTAALLRGVMDSESGLGDMARTGIGAGGGAHLGRNMARALGTGKAGKLWGAVTGGVLGAKLLEKKDKKKD